MEDLAVFKKRNTIDTTHLDFYDDSANFPKHFVIAVPDDVDKLFIQIQNQKADTFYVKTTPVIAHCCLTGYLFSSLQFNEELICNDCYFGSIIYIKR